MQGGRHIRSHSCAAHDERVVCARRELRRKLVSTTYGPHSVANSARAHRTRAHASRRVVHGQTFHETAAQSQRCRHVLGTGGIWRRSSCEPGRVCARVRAPMFVRQTRVLNSTVHIERPQLMPTDPRRPRTVVPSSMATHEQPVNTTQHNGLLTNSYVANQAASRAVHG